MPKPTVYFIQAQSGGPIKIGKTTRDAYQRMANLQTSHHEKLILLATTERHLEEDLHERFKHLRLHGEWFQDKTMLLRWIQAHARMTDEGRARLAKPSAWGEDGSAD